MKDYGIDIKRFRIYGLTAQQAEAIDRLEDQHMEPMIATKGSWIEAGVVEFNQFFTLDITPEGDVHGYWLHDGFWVELTDDFIHASSIYWTEYARKDEDGNTRWYT